MIRLKFNQFVWKALQCGSLARLHHKMHGTNLQLCKRKESAKKGCLITAVARLTSLQALKKSGKKVCLWWILARTSGCHRRRNRCKNFGRRSQRLLDVCNDPASTSLSKSLFNSSKMQTFWLYSTSMVMQMYGGWISEPQLAELEDLQAILRETLTLEYVYEVGNMGKRQCTLSLGSRAHASTAEKVWCGTPAGRAKQRASFPVASLRWLALKVPSVMYLLGCKVSTLMSIQRRIGLKGQQSFLGAIFGTLAMQRSQIMCSLNSQGRKA